MKLLRTIANLTSLIIPLGIVYTREQKSTGLAWKYVKYVKLYAQSVMMQTCQNNLGFNLYTAPSVCHVITISENWMKSEVRVSTYVGMLLLNTGN